MQAIFNDEDTVLHNFFAVNGPVAQLYTYALQASATSSSGTIASTVTSGATATVTANFSTLPNAVIYGWADNPYPNGHKGYAHVVKVTAFSPGRAGSAVLTPGNGIVWSLLPWIQSWSTFWTQYYTLVDRDGYVYVNVKRWDEDHEYNGPGQPAITFPNNHTLWQFLFHTTALANAFMLNDRGDGKVDPSVVGQPLYKSQCLKQAEVAVNYGVQSTACAQYIASTNASGPSGTTDHDYSLKFVDCNSVPFIHSTALDDLTGD
jgi:hypothetical protein